MLTASWPLAFAVTVGVEILVALVWARLAHRRPPFVDLVILNLITHPAAFALSTTQLGFTPIEVMVITVEAVGYRIATRLSWGQAVTLSLAANGVSLSLSFL